MSVYELLWLHVNLWKLCTLPLFCNDLMQYSFLEQVICFNGMLSSARHVFNIARKWWMHSASSVIQNVRAVFCRSWKHGQAFRKLSWSWKHDWALRQLSTKIDTLLKQNIQFCTYWYRKQKTSLPWIYTSSAIKWILKFKLHACSGWKVIMSLGSDLDHRKYHFTPPILLQHKSTDLSWLWTK